MIIKRHLLKTLFTSDRLIKLHTQNIMNNLDSSDTWTVIKPKSSHLLAPLTSLPRPGINIIKDTIKDKSKNILLYSL